VQHWHNHGWHVAIREAWRAGRASERTLTIREAARRVEQAALDRYADGSAARTNAMLEAILFGGNRFEATVASRARRRPGQAANSHRVLAGASGSKSRDR
jgi:hypothetical protein